MLSYKVDKIHMMRGTNLKYIYLVALFLCLAVALSTAQKDSSSELEEDDEVDENDTMETALDDSDQETENKGSNKKIQNTTKAPSSKSKSGRLERKKMKAAKKQAMKEAIAEKNHKSKIGKEESAEVDESNRTEAALDDNDQEIQNKGLNKNIPKIQSSKANSKNGNKRIKAAKAEKERMNKMINYS
jgi:hypothetical protein